MTDRGTAFDAWGLTTSLVDAAHAGDVRVITVWSFGMWVETMNDTVADAAEAAAASRHLARGTLRAPSGALHSFDCSLVDLGYTVDRARLFELAAVENDKPAFRALFRDEVLRAALTRRSATPAAGEPMPFRWCLAGHAGPISTFDHERGSFVALDPTGILGRFATTYGPTSCVDILLGDEHLTCVASFLSPGSGLVRVSARTSEVGRPIRFDALTSLIASCKELGSDLAGWRREIERRFPGSF